MSFGKNKNLLVIAVVAIVNALGYGIVFPIIYSYSIRFGLSDFGNGLLFAVFSICQFLATPIIGRLSDKYGRRPLLIISMAGTFASFLLMAEARSILMLFVARALDGLTAGNLPVAQAVISDTTKPSERARGFGIIGAAFGFGFVFGPAISAMTSSYSPAVPFYIAAGIALVGTLLTLFMLPETNKHMGQVKSGKLFDLPVLWRTLFDPNVGLTFVISLLYFFAFSLFTYAFQPYSVKVLHLSVSQISSIFTAIGIVGLITQLSLVPRVTKWLGISRAFPMAFVLIGTSFVLAFLSRNFHFYVGAMMLLALSNSFINPLINTILSRETDEKSQGTILGLNTSYGSLGQIAGPILGGTIATISVGYPFLAAAGVLAICLLLATRVVKLDGHRESAF